MHQVLEAIVSRGLQLPRTMRPPDELRLPFPWVRVWGDRLFVSGHGPLMADGRLAEPLGKVGEEVTLEQACAAARLTALAIIASLVEAGLDLDRLVWLRAFGMINAAPGFVDSPVINAFSDLIVDLFGPDRGSHARSAVGMFELPFGVPVEIEAELTIAAS